MPYYFCNACNTALRITPGGDKVVKVHPCPNCTIDAQDAAALAEAKLRNLTTVLKKGEAYLKKYFSDPNIQELLGQIKEHTQEHARAVMGRVVTDTQLAEFKKTYTNNHYSGTDAISVVKQIRKVYTTDLKTAKQMFDIIVTLF